MTDAQCTEIVDAARRVIAVDTPDVSLETFLNGCSEYGLDTLAALTCAALRPLQRDPADVREVLIRHPFKRPMKGAI